VDLGPLLGYALAAAKLADTLWDLSDRWRDGQTAGEDPVAQVPGDHQEEEVDAVSARAIKVTVEVFPGRTDQTMKVRASGKRGVLLLGKVRRVQYHQTLTSAPTEQLYVSAVLTAAQALVLS
jgi:hypothetical protein